MFSEKHFMRSCTIDAIQAQVSATLKVRLFICILALLAPCQNMYTVKAALPVLHWNSSHHT